MFTVLCWLFLAHFSSVYGNCWFSGKTRNTKEVCYGEISPLPPGLARRANVPAEIPTCVGHRRSIERQDNLCSSPLLDRDTKKLAAIPVRLYAVLDKYGQSKENYRPGSKWCYACKRNYYLNEAENNSTMDTRERKKVSLIPTCTFPSIHLCSSCLPHLVIPFFLVNLCIPEKWWKEDPPEGNGDRI